MWGKRPTQNTLEPPPIAQANANAVEVLRGGPLRAVHSN